MFIWCQAGLDLVQVVEPRVNNVYALMMILTQFNYNILKNQQGFIL